MKTKSFTNCSHILVTGGAGFIGSHLTECLVDLGAQVTVVDNLTTGHLDNLAAVHSKIEFINAELGKLLRNGQLDLKNYSHIFHLAANAYVPPSVKNPEMDYQVNLHNTFLLLEALRQAEHPPRLINISSAAVYGNPMHLPISEEDPTFPISPYGVSKLAAERYVAVYSQIYGIWSASLRLFSIYGPRQHKQVVYDFFCKLNENSDRLEVLGDGSQVRDFIYVLDVVQAMLLVAQKASGNGEIYNVASGQTHSIAELAEALCSVCGLSPEITYTGNVRPGDAQKWAVNISRLESLGFASKITLEKGLKEVQKWYRAKNV